MDDVNRSLLEVNRELSQRPTLVELNRNTEAVTHLVEAETIDAKDQQTQLIVSLPLRRVDDAL